MILEIKTQEGELFEVEVDEFNAEELNEKLNDSEVNTVVIGGIILSRFDVKRVVAKD